MCTVFCTSDLVEVDFTPERSLTHKYLTVYNNMHKTLLCYEYEMIMTMTMSLFHLAAVKC